MIEDGTNTIYGLICIAILVLWVWNLVLGIQVMRRLKEGLRWFEKQRDRIEDLLRKKEV
jgi:hypothetical protein